MVCTLNDHIHLFKTQVEPRTGGRVISLQCVDHFDVVSIVADLFFLQ